VSVQEIELTAEAAGKAQQVDVPQEARALSTLPRVDYEDAFVAGTEGAPDLTAEQWARAMLEDAPLATRRALRWTWLALGLRLGPTRSERQVFGWEIRHRSPDLVLLGADAVLGIRAELLFRHQDGTLLCATFLQRRNPIARAVWAAIERGHRRAVPDLLALAVHRARKKDRNR
jgi:hypothetical protein